MPMQFLEETIMGYPAKERLGKSDITQARNDSVSHEQQNGKSTESAKLRTNQSTKVC